MKIGSLAEIVPVLLFGAVLASLLSVGIFLQRLTSLMLCEKIPLSSATIQEAPDSDRYMVKVKSLSSEFSSKQMDRAKKEDQFVYSLWGSLYLNSGAELKDQQPLAAFGFAGLAALGTFAFFAVKGRKAAK